MVEGGPREAVRGAIGRRRSMEHTAEHTVERSRSLRSDNSDGGDGGDGADSVEGVVRPREWVHSAESKYGEDGERQGDDIELATYRVGSGQSDSGSDGVCGGYHDDEGAGESDSDSDSDNGNGNGNESERHAAGSAVWRRLLRIWRGPSRPSDRVEDFRHGYSPWVYLVNRVPLALGQRAGRRTRLAVLAVYFAGLLVTLRLLYGHLLFGAPAVDGTPAVTFPCGAAPKLWLGANDKCGLHARRCMGPFRRHETLYVRCPAFCGGAGLAYDVVKYADRRVQYQPYIVQAPAPADDGSPVYRGDSFPCIAAYEQGAISQLFGGVVALHLDDHFPYDTAEPPRTNHSGPALLFDSSFPASFTIGPAVGAVRNGHDLRLVGIVAGLVFTAAAALLAYDARVFYLTTVAVLYTTIVLCSDPPVIVDFLDNRYGGGDSAWRLLSLYVRRLIPLGLAVGFVWKCVAEYTFRAGAGGSPGAGGVQRLLFLAGAWLTALNNLTFDRLPLDRLLPSDIAHRPSSIAAFLFLVGLLLCCAVVQGRRIWRAGWFRRAAVGYAAGLAGLVWVGRGCSGLLALDGVPGGDVPGLVLRVHHWALGLALVFACKTRWTGSYIMQGLCVGLLLNGVGRWGFASVLEQHGAVLRDRDSVAGHLSRPAGVRFDPATRWAQVLFAPADSAKITVAAGPTPAKQTVSVNGRRARVKLLVNDVLVYAGPARDVLVPAPAPAAPLYLHAAVCYRPGPPAGPGSGLDGAGDDDDDDDDSAADGSTASDRGFRCSGWSAAMRY